MLKRRSGCIWIAAGLAIALLAGLLAYSVMLRSSRPTVIEPRTPTVDVVVASRAMAIQEVINPGDVELRTMPADVVPETALRRADEAVGRLTIIPLSPGEMLLSSHVISPTIKGAHVGWTMDPDKVAMAFPADDLMSRNYLLTPGDHVDILFSIGIEAQAEASGGLVTFNALQNLEIAAIISPAAEPAQRAEAGTRDTGPAAIVFALDPQDALILKHLRDLGGTVDIVLRAPEATEMFETEPVNINYLIDKYQIRIPVLP